VAAVSIFGFARSRKAVAEKSNGDLGAATGKLAASAVSAKKNNESASADADGSQNVVVWNSFSDLPDGFVTLYVDGVDYDAFDDSVVVIGANGKRYLLISFERRRDPWYSRLWGK